MTNESEARMRLSLPCQPWRIQDVVAAEVTRLHLNRAGQTNKKLEPRYLGCYGFWGRFRHLAFVVRHSGSRSNERF
jgi:hypothetical protein